MRKWLVMAGLAGAFGGTMQARAGEVLPMPRLVEAERTGHDFRGVKACDKEYQGYYAIRVAEMATLPGMEDVFRLIEAILSDPTNGAGIGFDIKASEIEQIAGRLRFEVKILNDPAEAEGRTGSAGGNLDIGQIRLNRDVDWPTQIRKAFKRTKENLHQGKPYYECEMPPALARILGVQVKNDDKPHFYFFPIDTRTLVVAEEERIKRLIEGREETPVTGLERGEWRSSTLVFSVPDVAEALAGSMRKILESKEAIPWPETVRTEAQARLEGLKSIRIGIQMGEELALRIEAGTKSGTEAALLARRIQDLLTMAKDAGLAPTGPAKTREEFIERLILDLPRQSSVQVVEDAVKVGTNSPIPLRAPLQRLPKQEAPQSAEGTEGNKERGTPR